MKTYLFTIATMILIAFNLTSCGNTIKGIGQDTANTVNATPNAGKRVDRAVRS